MCVVVFNVSVFIFTLFLCVKCVERRVLLHSEDDVIAMFQTMTNEINALKLELSETKAQLAAVYSNTDQGSTYVRWGRTMCQDNGTELVYRGYTGGNYFSIAGGAADFICLTNDVLWGEYDDTVQKYSGRVYGAEFEFGELFADGGAKFFGQDLYEHDAPCAVCRTVRSSNLMIPGRNQCYPGWTLEYSGYLVSGRGDSDHDHSSTNYICLDSRPETVIGDATNENGKLMVLVEAYCGSLKCPPYVQNREISCVVCSR